LRAHHTAALQTRLGDHPKVALAAVVLALALDVFYSAARTGSVVRIRATVACLDRSAEGIEESKARTQLAATTKAVRKRLPKDPDKLWGWLIEQDQKTLLAILAVCAGHTVDAVARKHDGGEAAALMQHATELGRRDDSRRGCPRRRRDHGNKRAQDLYRLQPGFGRRPDA
jgi:ParB family chromosome partitioning protein